MEQVFSVTGFKRKLNFAEGSWFVALKARFHCESDSYSATNLCCVLDSASPTHRRLSMGKYYNCLKYLLFYIIIIIIIGYDDKRVRVINNCQIS